MCFSLRGWKGLSRVREREEEVQDVEERERERERHTWLFENIGLSLSRPRGGDD